MAISQLNINKEDRELIKKIQAGDWSAIMQGLSHIGAFYRINATINAVRYEVRDPVVKIYLDRLKEDQIVMNGYRVSEFAISALDILGFERYNGNDLRIKRLIDSKFDFG